MSFCQPRLLAFREIRPWYYFRDKHFLDISLFKHLHQVAYICEDVFWFGDNADVIAPDCQKDEIWSGCCHLHHSICDGWRVQTTLSLEDALSQDMHVRTAEVFEPCSIQATEETENRHVFFQIDYWKRSSFGRVLFFFRCNIMFNCLSIIKFAFNNLLEYFFIG